MLKIRVKVGGVVPSGIAILCFAILVVVSARPLKQRDERTPIKRKASLDKLIVSKLRQPGSPLTITKVIVDDSPEPLTPVIQCYVENNGGKSIIVYAIKHEAVFSQRTGTFSGSVTFNPVDSENAMRPGDTRLVEIYGVRYGELPQSVTVSVDFVEFVDGSRWGPDTLNNGDRINGVRAGARAEQDALMKVLITEGTKGLMNALDSGTRELDKTVDRSAEWLDGFRHGVGWIRERVRAKGQSYSEIEKELRRPIDLIERR